MATATTTMNPETAELFAKYVVPNYTRFPVALGARRRLVRVGRPGAAVSGFLPRLGLQPARPLSAASRGSGAAAGGRADPRAQHLAHRSARPLGPTAFRAKLRRQGVLLQFGRRSERSGDQAGPAAHAREAVQDHHVSRRLSRPHLRRHQRHGPAQIPRRHRPAAGRVSCTRRSATSTRSPS